MKIGTKGNKAPTVTNLNMWGGAKNNEQRNTSNGFGGKTPDKLACDTSNEQVANGKTFKGFTPNRGSFDYRLGGVKDGNENPRGFKQDAKPKAYKPSGV